MVLSRWAALLAGFGVLGVLATRSWWAVLACTGVLVLAVVTDLVLCASPRAVRVQRDGDTSLRLGDRGTSTVTLTNLSRRTLRAVVRNAWTPSAGASGGIAALTIGPRQRRRAVATLLPTRRGDRSAGPVVVRSWGPLRLAGRQLGHDVPWTVRVLPPFTSRKHLPSRVARLRELDGRSAVLQRGQGSEFDSLREYVPGDDVRSIDWRGTARSTTVVVKTWRPERDRHVLIVLDSGRTSAGRVDDQPKLDHAMDAALLLAALATRAGDRVDLLIADRAVRAKVQRTSAAEVLSRFVEAMAPVEAVLVESDHHLIATQISDMVSQRSLVVLLTGLDRASVTEGLLPVLGVVLRKHRVVLAAVSDPRIDELVEAHQDPTDAYAAAAAATDVARRQQTVATLRRAGISVVQGSPERFAPALADHYLALKKTGQL